MVDAGFPRGANPGGLIYYYRPRSEASEGYVFTGICHSFCLMGGGGRCATPKVSGQHLPPSPQDQVTTPPSPPGPGHNTSLLPEQHLPPLLDNTSLPWTTPLFLPPLDNTSPPPPGLCAGGRYASYWNAFLFGIMFASNGIEMKTNELRGMHPSRPRSGIGH